MLLLLLAAPASAGPAPFLVPDGAVKLFSDDFDSPKYALNTNLWTRITGKPDWQLQVRGRGHPLPRQAAGASPVPACCSTPGQHADC